jgi:hypothetical protein
MHRHSCTPRCLITLVLLALSSCSSPYPVQQTVMPQLPPTPGPTPMLQPLDLIILHTNDVMGYTEPCG